MSNSRLLQGFKEDSVNTGFRPEILELAVPALSKAMELTLDSIEAAIVTSTNGDGDALETIEGALLQPGAEGMRPSSQLAKIITALLWLNRTEEACESDVQALIALTVKCELVTRGSLSIAAGWTCTDRMPQAHSPIWECLKLCTHEPTRHVHAASVVRIV